MTKERPLGLPLKEQLHRKLKVVAAVEGKSMTEILEEALQEYLSKYDDALKRLI